MSSQSIKPDLQPGILVLEISSRHWDISGSRWTVKTKTISGQFKWMIHKFVTLPVEQGRNVKLVMRDIGRGGEVFNFSFSFVARRCFVCWFKWHLLRREAPFSLCSLLSVLSLFRQCVSGYISGYVTLILNPTTQIELNTFHIIPALYIIQYVTLITCTCMYVINLLKYVFYLMI
jgi:hypothetical protein